MSTDLLWAGIELDIFMLNRFLWSSEQLQSEKLVNGTPRKKQHECFTWTFWWIFSPLPQKKRKQKKNNRPLGGLQTLRPFFRWTVCAVIFRGDLGGLRGLVEGLSRALITEVVRHKDCIFCDECTAKAGRCNGGWGWGTYKGKEKPRGNNTIWGSSILVIFFWGWVGFQGIVRSRHHKSGDLFTHGWDGGIRRGLRMEKSSTSCELLQLGGIFSLSHLLHPFAWVFSNTGG